MNTFFNYVIARKKPILITIGSLAFLFVVITGASFAYAKAYEDRILPNIFIGNINVGKLTQQDATQILQQRIDALLSQGVDVFINKQAGHLDLRVSILKEPDLAHDIIYFQTSQLVDQAMHIGRTESFWNNFTTPVTLLFRPVTVDAVADIDGGDIQQQLIEQFDHLQTPSLPADYLVNLSNELPIRFLPGKDGAELDIDSAIEALTQDALDLELNDLTVELKKITYEMTAQDALSLSDQIIAALYAAPYHLTYTSETYKEYWWNIEADDIADWIEPYYIPDEKNEQIPALQFAGDGYEDFLQQITDDVNIDPINARFVMENGVVTEFIGSQDGIAFDAEKTMEELHTTLGTSDAIVTITITSTEPDIPTAQVNDFGITEIIGIGTSDFSGSRSNRISNIEHGASKLNGLLIAPGETISLINELGPFTIADGYLAELVIKGDEIKPEVGGGLCQIGTTAFRAAMNAGLQIDERRNHSLVVSYYNDPSNGNPGTDATIYDPYPDFKFTNDYENYILLTTEVDVPNRDVIFTFWGTDDGRHGYYSAPVILSWTGYGDPEYTETLDLEPDEESCQSPHPGATAQFTYYVDYVDGEQFSETYTSVYRSLPMICLIGVEELTQECDSDDCEVSDESEELEEPIEVDVLETSEITEETP